MGQKLPQSYLICANGQVSDCGNALLVHDLDYLFVGS